MPFQAGYQMCSTMFLLALYESHYEQEKSQWCNTMIYCFAYFSQGVNAMNYPLRLPCMLEYTPNQGQYRTGP